MRTTSGTLNWPPDMWRSVAALFTIWSRREQAEVDRHDLDDRPHAAERRADAGADEGRFRQRRVADALGAELLEQPVAHGEGAAVAADVLAHQEDARIRRSASRSARRTASR